MQTFISGSSTGQAVGDRPAYVGLDSFRLVTHRKVLRDFEVFEQCLFEDMETVSLVSLMGQSCTNTTAS